MGKLRDALKSQGVEISEAVETELLKEFAEKKEAEEKEGELKELKLQLEKRDADIELLKKTKPEDLTEKLKDMEKQYEDDKKILEESLSNLKLESALKVELMKSGTKDLEILAGIVDKTQLKIDSQGKLSGLSEQMEQLKKEKSFLFEDAKETKPAYEYKPSTGESAAVNTGSLGDAIVERMGLQ